MLNSSLAISSHSPKNEWAERICLIKQLLSNIKGEGGTLVVHMYMMNMVMVYIIAHGVHGGTCT